MLNKSLSCYGLDMEKHSQSDSGSVGGGGGEFNDNGKEILSFGQIFSQIISHYVFSGCEWKYRWSFEGTGGW